MIEKRASHGATLILGASGKTGRRVVARLSQRGIPVRAGSRSGQPPFDWERPETWEPVLGDIDAVYVTYYPDLALPGAAEAVHVFSRLAVASGVRRIVLLSGRGEENAQRAEHAVRTCGTEWTIIRSSWFSQNFSEGFLLDGMLAGELRFPAANVGEPFIDADDIADIAAAALTEGKHKAKLYDVTGPRLLTFEEAVREISRAAGRAIRYAAVSAESYSSMLLEAGLPAELVASLVQVFATVLDGRNARVTDGVQEALGRAPRDFSDYVRMTADSRVWNPVALGPDTMGSRERNAVRGGTA